MATPFTMESLHAHDMTHKNGETTHYYEGGSPSGIPLIFIHGWPDIAESWKHQLSHFSTQSKYRIIAPDMRGYGLSSAPSDKRSYSLEALVTELIELADKLHIPQAIWIGHDWGCAVTNALAAHFPSRCHGLVAVSVPYRSMELGLDYVLQFINRDIYPEDEYKYGQWEYMKYYELHTQASIDMLEKYTDLVTKLKYSKHDASKWGQPAPTSRYLREGWFGGHPEALPDIPLEYTSLDQTLYDNLVLSHRRHGWFPPTAYYLNHDVNAEYAKSEENGGVLEFPVLYIDAKFDSVLSPSTTPAFRRNQERFVKRLTYRTVEAGHWVQLERPAEVNAVLDEWLGENF